MATCNKTETYYKGEDIDFELVSTEEFEDLDGEDWELIFYSQSSADIRISKSEMVFVEERKYEGNIPSSVTKNLIPDKFTCELLYGTDKKKIALSLAFELRDSHSKTYV